MPLLIPSPVVQISTPQSSVNLHSFDPTSGLDQNLLRFSFLLIVYLPTRHSQLFHLDHHGPVALLLSFKTLRQSLAHKETQATQVQ